MLAVVKLLLPCGLRLSNRIPPTVLLQVNLSKPNQKISESSIYLSCSLSGIYSTKYVQEFPEERLLGANWHDLAPF